MRERARGGYRDGTYRVRNSDTGLCLALASLSTAAGVAVVAEEYTALPHQDWRLVYNPTTPTQFALVSAYSGHAIQPLNNSWSNGAPLVVEPYNAGLNLQHWTASLRRAHPKKGIAATNSTIGTRYSAAQGLTYHQDYYNRLNAFWSYTWNKQSSDTFPYLGAHFTYIPMQWGDFGWDHGLSTRVPIERNHRDLQETGKPVALLAFNEPEHEEQGFISVDEAIRRWPRLEARDVPLVSPAPANVNGPWFADFITKADARGLRRDYTAVHWYAGPNAGSLISHLTNVYNDFGRPVWLTEFGNVRWSDASNSTWTEADTFNFLAEFLWRAESLTWLKRYSIFGYIEEAPGAPDPVSPDPADAPRSNIIRYDGTLTPLGQLYAGWDGVTSIVQNTAYHLHNHGAYLRAHHPVAATGPAGVSPDSDVAGLQWFLSPGVTANTVRILSTRDGRPLRYVDGVAAPVTLGAVGETGPAVEWSTAADQYGRYYIQHPASANKRLRLNANGTYAMVASTDTGDLSKWRFVRPAVADSTSVPTDPYAAWTASIAWGGADSTAAADPDRDGLANLLEYAVSLDPLAASAGPSASLTTSLPHTLQLTFLRARSELTYEVLSSSDLVTWMVFASNPGQVGQIVTVTNHVSTSPRRFLRLRVTKSDTTGD